MRADVVRVVGNFDASIPYLVDLDYWMRLMAHGPAWCSRAALAAFRISPNQWSATIGNRQAREFGLFLDRLAQGPLRGRPILIRYGKLCAEMNGVLRSIFYRFL